MKLRKRSGEELYAMIGSVPMINDDGEMIGTMGVVTDITERKRAEQQLMHDALHDGLTGLANRALFMDHLQRSIERGKSRHSSSYAVLFLDFDRFKHINDSLGHLAGDDFLRSAAQRIVSATRSADLVARLGGDEFIVLLNDLVSPDDAIQVAERIVTDLQRPFPLGGREIFVTGSIGIALSTEGYLSADDMLRDADIAMYRAKSDGRNRYRIFDSAMGEQAARQLSLDTAMRQGLERGEFELHYQPIVNLETSELTGFESLVRWAHPEHGLIPPSEFIPSAEERGMILPLGQWILDESCRQLQEWKTKYLVQPIFR